MTKSSNPSSQTTNNGSSNIPPKTSSNSPSNMTMNGNKMPAQKQAISDQSSAANIARPNTSTINNSSAARQGKKQFNVHNSNSSGHSVGLSGVAPADNDTAYCTEIARRSVARAALHLGMEGMEGEALDSLGSILMGYMEMVRRQIVLYNMQLYFFVAIHSYTLYFLHTSRDLGDHRQKIYYRLAQQSHQM